VLSVQPELNFNTEGLEVTVHAEDREAEGLSVEDVFTMIVTPVNDAPTVEAAIGEFTVDEDADRTDIANLDDVFTDLDGDALFYSLIDPPAELGLEIADGVLSVLIQEYLME